MPAETSVVAELAGRYAAALFDLAKQEGTLDGVADDLAGVGAMLAESADLRRLVESPVISREDQAKAMAALAEKAQLSPLTIRFVGVVARQRRLFALGHMIRRFHALLSEHRGETTAEVTSATPLGESQLSAMRRALAKAAGRRVKLDVSVDEGLIGGLVVKLGSRMVDSSIRAKLERLRLTMKEVS